MHDIAERKSVYSVDYVKAEKQAGMGKNGAWQRLRREEREEKESIKKSIKKEKSKLLAKITKIESCKGVAEIKDEGEKARNNADPGAGEI